MPADEPPFISIAKHVLWAALTLLIWLTLLDFLRDWTGTP